MDGLSAAAGGIAVISLAIQLVDSVQSIRRFLSNVSKAPQELARLLELLAQLELIFKSIQIQIKKQQKQPGDLSNEIDSACVLAAMKSCGDKLSRIEKVVRRGDEAPETGNTLTWSLGSIRLACKRKSIEDLEIQLQRSIELLNLTISINLTLGTSLFTELVLT